MSPLVVFYIVVTAAITMATLTMPFRHKSERIATASIAGLILAATLYHAFVPEATKAASTVLFLVVDFVIAMLAGWMFMRRPKFWHAGIIASSIFIILMDSFWGIYPAGVSKLAWAWINNSVTDLLLLCVLYGALEFTLTCKWRKFRRKPNRHFTEARKVKKIDGSSGIPHGRPYGRRTNR